MTFWLLTTDFHEAHNLLWGNIPGASLALVLAAKLLLRL